MAGTIRARVRGGMLEPLEALEMPEGEVVTITVIRLPTGEAGGGLERSAGGWKGLIDAEELKRNIYTVSTLSGWRGYTSNRYNVVRTLRQRHNRITRSGFSFP